MEDGLRFFADLHIHSKYSRNPSRRNNLEQLARWSLKKGIQVLGTGDGFHPAWLANLREKLLPAEEGLFRLHKTEEETIFSDLPESCRTLSPRFVLTAEVHCVFRRGKTSHNIHSFLLAPSFGFLEQYAAQLTPYRHDESEGRPVFQLDLKEALQMALSLDPNIAWIPSHIWGHSYSFLSSRGGFSSVDEAFEELTPSIFALETGQASTPSLNRRLSLLDDFALLSNSNAESPEQIGRKANLFATDLSLPGILAAIRSRDPQQFLGTVECPPQRGKYHLDGHRACKARQYPRETIRLEGLCDVCKNPINKGILHRIEARADRAEGEQPPSSQREYLLLPLRHILAEVLDLSPKSQRVRQQHERLLRHLGPELPLLLDLPLDQINYPDLPTFLEAIERVRQGKFYMFAGYDGEPGQIRLFREGETKRAQQMLFAHEEIPPAARQLSLFHTPRTQRERGEKAQPIHSQLALFPQGQKWTEADVHQRFPSSSFPPFASEVPLSYETIDEAAVADTLEANTLDLPPQTNARFVFAETLAAETYPPKPTLPKLSSSPPSTTPSKHPKKQAPQLALFDASQRLPENDDAPESTHPQSIPAQFSLHPNKTSLSSPTLKTPTLLRKKSPSSPPSSPPPLHKKRTQQTTPLTTPTTTKLPKPTPQLLQRTPETKETPPAVAQPSPTPLPVRSTSTSRPLFASRSAFPPPRQVLATLNIEQRAAVTHTGSPLLLQAGPGTGKTKVIAHRIAYLVAKRILHPTHILVFTATQSAARQLLRQCEKLLGSIRGITVGTFHQFCLNLLQEEAQICRILGQSERYALLQELARQQNISLPPPQTRRILDAISLFKQQQLPPEEVAQLTFLHNDNKLPTLYQAYHDWLQQSDLFDLDDLLFESVALLQRTPSLRHQLQLRFRSIHVDEYQDLFPAEDQCLRQLVGPQTDLFVAGDPDQALRGYQGASLQPFHQFLSPESPWNHPRRMTLWRSYRSPEAIQEASAALIASIADPQRIPLTPVASTKSMIQWTSYTNEQTEAQGVAQTIEELVAGNTTSAHPPSPSETVPLSLNANFQLEDIAIIYRSSEQLPPLEQALKEAGLPYQKVQPFCLLELFPELQVTLAILRYLSTPVGDHLALQTLQRSWPGVQPFLSQPMQEKETPDQQLQKLAASKHTNTATQLVADFLLRLRELTHTATPNEFVSHLLDHLPRMLPPTHCPSLSAQTLLREYANASPRLTAFFPAFLLQQDPNPFLQGIKSITLLHAQATQGTHYPIVFLLGCNDHIWPLTETDGFHERSEDEIRLFYTALSRTQHHLFLSSTQQQIHGVSRTNKPSRFLKALQPFLQERKAPTPPSPQQDPKASQLP